MGRDWHLNMEPRNTIVCEMLDAWQGRNAAREREVEASIESARAYWCRERLNCQDTLYVLQRIRKATKR